MNSENEADGLPQQQIPYDVAGVGQEQDPNFVGGSFSNVAQGLSGHYRNIMMTYWQNTINSIEHDDHEFKIHQLPLARIKKVMKADEDVKMISAEAPILFAKGCDIFITELTMRAWIHAEENKRRTLQRSDIASALQKSDMFDFLIDIVPREEAMASSSSARKSQQHAQYAHYDEAEYQAAAAAAANEEQQQHHHQQHQHHQQEYIDEAQYEHQQPGAEDEEQDDAGAATQGAGAPDAPGGPPLFNDISNIYNGYRQY
jgi:histone H3/H4